MENKKLFNRALRAGLLAGILFKLIDIYTTLIVVVENTKHEFNPTMRYVLDHYGILPGLTVNALFVILLLCVLYREKRLALLGIADLLLAIIAFINILDKFLFGYVVG